MRDFLTEIGAILGAGGEAHMTWPIGRAINEAADFLTVNSVGSGDLDGLVGTYSESRKSFDNPTEYTRDRYQFPFMQLNSVDEEMDTPDIAALSRDDSSGEGFSWGALIQISNTAADRYIMAKGNTSDEYRIWITSGELLRVALRDKSAVVTVDREGGAAVPTGVPVFVGGSYDGSGGATAADGIHLYLRGLLADGTATNNASYVAMENTATTFTLANLAGGGFFGDKMGFPFLTHRVLSAVEFQNLNDIYVAMQRPQPQRSRLLGGVL